MSSIGGSEGIQLDGVTSDYQRRLILGALQRVIRAQHTLAEARDALDRQYHAQENGEGPATNTFARAEVADVAQLNAIRKDLDELRSSHTVFRKQAEKRKLSLELAERLALSRLGYVDYEDYAAPRDLPADDGIIDLAYIEYAEQELAAAEHELAALRRGEFEALALPAAPPHDAVATPVPTPAEALDVWAGPPPLPRRKLPHRKQPKVATVTFAKLPELPKTDGPPTLWSTFG
jgi:hypothetical protein